MLTDVENTTCDPASDTARTDRKNISSEQSLISTALRKSAVFRSLDAELLTDLESVLDRVMLPGGEVLFREGDPADSLYMVINGRLRTLRSGARELGPGDTIGESSVLANVPRTATVIALRDSLLARLSRASFEQICTRHPLPAIFFFTRNLIEIEREAPLHPKSPPRTIAMVASHRSVDLEAFARQLAACLGSGTRRVLRLTSDVVTSALGTNAGSTIFGGSRDPELVTWLDNQEQEHDCVLYQADYEASPWTARCLRQADRIVLVADARRTPHLSCFRALAFAKGQPVNLVLVHPPGAKPSGTIAWLKAHSFDRHYHLHAGDTVDFLRLSRCLMNQGFGLVLGGGFARGVAHLGVLRALDELAITPDAFGGTSMGSLIAALHLCGYHETELYPMLLAQGKSALRDFTFPMVALLSGRKVREVLEPLIADKKIEDLWLPAFFVATNLTRGNTEILDRGPVLDALLASSRVPGMFPPVVRGSDLLVDGGLVNNVPADIMRDFCPGHVIAVDVSPKTDFKAAAGVSSEASGWKLLRESANPFSESREWPSVFSVLMRTMTLTSDAYLERIRALADLYLAPPTADFAFNDFDRGPEMAEKAYRYARPKIVDWMKRTVRNQT